MDKFKELLDSSNNISAKEIMDKLKTMTDEEKLMLEKELDKQIFGDNLEKMKRK